jgi:hypothetical protein
MIVFRADPDMRRVRKGTQGLKARIRSKLQSVGQMYAAAMVAEAPRSRSSTTHGADRIKFHLSGASGAQTIDFTMPDYFRYVVEGTRPHDIVAHGRALAFTWNGRRVFFARVHHPGTKPNDFIGRAWKAVRSRALALLGSAAREWWVGK